MERNNNNTDDSKQNNMMQQAKKKKRRMSGGQKITIGILSGLIAGIFAMWITYAGMGQSMMVSKSDYDRFVKAESIYSSIQNSYYTDVNEEELTTGMYKGIVEGLNDPYSAYMTDEEYKLLCEEMEGQFVGIGVVITINDNEQIEIVSVMDGSPAKKAGLEPGDIINRVDGTEFKTLEEATKHLKGKQDTEVQVEYLRDKKAKTVSIKRSEIKTVSVTSKVLKEHIGYIDITEFITGTGSDFKKELDKLEKNKDLDGLIIDLRANGGGLVQESLDIADELLDESVIVCYLDNKGNKTYSRAKDGKTKLKYVLLVDEGTASASEILTAAIKDNKGGKIVGTKTFGKGIIQQTQVLDDGSALKLTVMQYLSPNGTEIHKKGIEPDYVVENEEDSSKDAQLKKAMDLLSD